MYQDKIGFPTINVKDNFYTVYRFATGGPFKKAWRTMENNPDSFWSSRDDAVSKMLLKPNIAIYDFIRKLGGREEFKKCLINHIPNT